MYHNCILICYTYVISSLYDIVLTLFFYRLINELIYMKYSYYLHLFYKRKESKATNILETNILIRSFNNNSSATNNNSSINKILNLNKIN